MRTHISTRLLSWTAMVATVALLASVQPQCLGLSVRFIVTEPPGTNPYDILGLRGCNQVAHADSSVQCLSSEVSMTLPLSFIESEIQRVSVLFNPWNRSAQDDVIVALGHGYAPALTNLARQFPAKSFVSIDQALEPPRNNTIGLSFSEEHAGFQAGALAGLFSRSRRVGVIGGLPVTPVLKFVNSYLTGVQYVCPTCEVHVESIPTFSNVTAGQKAAVALLAHGADVVFNAAGAAGGGGILEAAQRGAFVIGVDLDESQSTFRNQPAQVAVMLLSSAIKRTDLAVKAALESVRLGKHGYNQVLDSTTGGVGLLQPFVSTSSRNFTEPINVALRSASSSDGCPTATRWTRQEVLERIESGLQSGTLTPGISPKSGFFESLIAPANRSWYDVTPFGSRTMVQPNMQGHSAVDIGMNRILAWGGQTRLGEYPTQVMVLDFDLFAWRAIQPRGSGPIPNGRMFFAMGFDAISKALYVYGGQDDFGVLRDMWAFDLVASEWLPLSFATAGLQDAHPGNRTNVAHTAIDRTMYVFGGIRPNYVVLGDLWAFNMATRTWTRIETSGAQPGALQHATMVANSTSTLIVFGGTDARGVHSNGLFSLDLKTRTWTQHHPLSTRLGTPARLPALERVRGVQIDARRVLLAGGIGPDGSTNATYVWKLDENVWSRSAYTDLPSALHSHALVAFNQAAYLEACQSKVALAPERTWMICEPQQNPIVLALSGMASKAAAYGGVLISAANPEPQPPPIGMLDEGAKMAVTVLCALGMMVDLAAVAFLGKYWKHPVVRAAHPVYSVWVGVGGLLAHIGIVASTWEVDGRNSLQLTAFLVGGGFSLMTAAVTAKSYMVYSVLRMLKQTTATFPSLIASPFALQCVLVALWFSFDHTPVVTVNVQGTLWAIRSRDNNWMAMSALPILSTVILGLYFAYKNRHVQSRYHESQYLMLASGLMAAGFALLVPITLLLESPLIQYLLTSLLIVLTTMGVQVVYFGPKLQLVVLGDASGRRSEARAPAFGRDAGGTMATSIMKCKMCRQDFTDEGVYLSARDNLGPPIAAAAAPTCAVGKGTGAGAAPHVLVASADADGNS